ncbi:LuxR C-terminal-related transcriptional regulator [Streptomyces sp. NPDC012769]|uniref:LuxR C-terminal-related transcriptional regulator n=1 Tax=Streptomyces sp. NPDC012769 TaxID=3364848 RepID=UPI0036D1F617
MNRLPEALRDLPARPAEEAAGLSGAARPADGAAGLSGAARRLYGLALSHPVPLEQLPATRAGSRTTAQLPEQVATGLPEQAAGEPPSLAERAPHPVEELLRLGLIRPSSHDPAAFTAVAPDTARLRTLAPVVRELARLHRQLEQANQVYDDLAAAHRHDLAPAARGDGPEALHGEPAVRAAVSQLLGEGTRELLSSQPGGAQGGDGLWHTLFDADELSVRGVRARILVQHTARFHPDTAARVRRLTAAGAEVRSRSDACMPMLVIDGRSALIDLRGERGGALLIRDENVVAFARDAFEQAWLRADAFPAEYDPESVEAHVDEVKRDIARLLVEGVEDKVIARRMGLSLRSCQRHVSDLMRRLGARNRLHAGYLLGRAGL